MSALEAPPPVDWRIAEANHRIANHLTMLAAHARLQAGSLRSRAAFTREEGAAMLEEVAARVHTIARLHQMLNQSPTMVDCSAYLAEVCSIAANAAAANGEFHLATNFEPGLKLPRTQLGAIAMILIEGVINAGKYAHPAAGVVGRIEVRGRTLADGAVCLEVCDDGVGLPDGFRLGERGGGVGMKMMRSLAAQIPAEIAFRSTPLGLTVSLRLPPSR